MAGYTQGTFFNVTPLASVEINEWDELQAAGWETIRAAAQAQVNASE